MESSQLLPVQDPLHSVRSYGALQRRSRSRSMSQGQAQPDLRESTSIINFHSKRTRPRASFSNPGRHASLPEVHALRRPSTHTTWADSEVVASDDEVLSLGSDEDAVSIDDDDDIGFFDNSPYAEVRACVSNSDDHTLQADTCRMWVISTLFVVTGSAVNLFFSMRFPSIAITALLAQLLAHPIGLAWTRLVPEWRIAGIQLNDKSQPWNVKEHTCVFAAANVSFAFAFATDVLTESIKFYDLSPTITYQILFVLSTQVIGYSFAGLARRWLVYPSSMVWPSTLVNCALFQVLHPSITNDSDAASVPTDDLSDKTVGPSRTRFFVVVCVTAMLWAFIPSFFVPALSYFAIFTWIFPKNIVVNTVLGARSGMGILPITLDWAQISFTGSPILVPWWAQVNALVGIAICLWVVAPIIYFSNSLFTGFLPFLNSNVFDNTGHYYDVSRIINQDVTFDLAKYQAYSPLYFPAAYVVSYFAAFASLAALISHCYINYRADLVRQWRASQNELSNLAHDVHVRLMRRYDEVPTWWYVITFVVCLLVACYIVLSDVVGLPLYGLLLALGICAIFFVPMGITVAVSNQNVSTALLCQLVCGFLFEGKPIANMVFLTYGYISGMQGIRFAADMKIGTYMKIEPRLLFRVQLYATCLGALVQVATMNFLFANVPKICTMDAPNGLTCPIARVHFNSSIIWGLIGPRRLFGSDSIYWPLVLAFPLGFIAPFVVRAVAGKRRFEAKDSVWRLVNLPVVLSSMTWVPPGTGLNFSSWALCGFLSNYLWKRRRPDSWGKYNFVLSAALDMGLAVALVIGFLAIVYPGRRVEVLTWLTADTCDTLGCARLKLEPGQHFGPSTWT
ncbi:hypothetical protein PYCC9005_000935 [Savitreella phatthalungensis]